MKYSLIKELPAPVNNLTVWPWTEERRKLPDKTQDGREWPRISIVTPSYNQGSFLEETIRSVLLQGYPNLEYIVIDGGSTDDSVKIIKKYSSWLDFWISEPDKGQSNAINKGMLKCTGDIFNWINADDMLYPGALQAIAKAWLKNPAAIIAGPVINFYTNGTENQVDPNNLTLENFLNIKKAKENRWNWHQPGTFLPLEQVKNVGGLKEDLHFSMDHILMIELLQICKVTYVPEVLAKFRLHKNSKTETIGFPRFTLERVEALRDDGRSYAEVTRDELKADHVNLLITCGALAIRNRQYGTASKYLVKSILISPLLVFRELLKRNFFRKFLRKFGRRFLRVFRFGNSHPIENNK
ncbi:MAG: glycosyltransferase family 2 protein [Sedimentisphaerales bacterium]